MNLGVFGYASIDSSYEMDSFAGLGKTTIIRKLHQDSEAGGIARIFYGLREGNRCSAISWVGEDDLSKSWISALNEMKVDTSGVEELQGSAPSCFLFHSRNGETITFYDTGFGLTKELTLSEIAESVLSKVDVTIFAVGPRLATEKALEVVSQNSLVIWIVKADPSAYPPKLLEKMHKRSDVVIHSANENNFVSPNEFRKNAIVISTNGSHPISWKYGEKTGSISPRRLDEVSNTTGAGDVFSGYFVGEWLSSSNLEKSINLGAEATFEYLTNRAIKRGL